MDVNAATLVSALSAVGAIIAAISSMINRGAIREVHLTMNSRLDALLKSSIAQARGEGRAEGIASTIINPEVTALAAAKVLSTAAQIVADDKLNNNPDNKNTS